MKNSRLPNISSKAAKAAVWITADEDNDGRINFKADSDAIIVKGIISLLISVLSGHTAQEILDSDLYFIKEVGLQEHFVAHPQQRAGGNGKANAPVWQWHSKPKTTKTKTNQYQ